jgi:hypothetical protein
MKPNQKRLEQHQRQEAEAVVHQETGQTVEFASVDKLLQHDARQHPPSARLAERVRESVRQEAAPSRSWWRRLTGA